MDIIQILNQDFNQIGILSNWQEFIWMPAWNAETTFELTLDCDAHNADKLTEGAIVYADADDAVGIIDYVNPIKDGDNNILTVSGYGLKDITKRRVTVPPSGSAYDTYSSAYPDAIVASLIDKHIINPTDTNRQISGFTVAAAPGIGTAVDFSTRFKSLQEEIYELLVADGLGLKCSLDIAAQMAQFSVAHGVDRTIDQDTNARAMFSLVNGSLVSLNHEIDASSYKNMLYVGGQGEGTDREVITLGSTLTGWDRNEVFVDARDVDNTDGLYDRGNSKLADLSKLQSITAEVADAYSGQYSLGDYVSVYNEFDGAWYNVQIAVIADTYAAGKAFRREITLGKTPTNAYDVIRYKFAQINNILTQ